LIGAAEHSAKTPGQFSLLLADSIPVPSLYNNKVRKSIRLGFGQAGSEREGMEQQFKSLTWKLHDLCLRIRVHHVLGTSKMPPAANGAPAALSAAANPRWCDEF
jgi:hypothetical protein